MPGGGLQFGVIYLLKSGSSQAKKLKGLGSLLLDYYVSNRWLPGPEGKKPWGYNLAFKKVHIHFKEAKKIHIFYSECSKEKEGREVFLYFQQRGSSLLV